VNVRRIVWVGVIALSALACRKDQPITVLTNPSATVAASAPVDHLAPDELLEGDAKAFGLTLPRGMRIENAFSDVVFARGPGNSPAVVEYVRSHVREGKMIKPSWSEPNRTTFDHVRVPAMPDKELVIYVEPAVGMVATTRVEVHDATPTKAPVLPDEAARWAAVGLKPNGQPLDPTRVQ
jgi:hypothetical protein